MPTDSLFANRYRLESRLGVGGMATVQLAFDTRLERYVAVKLLAEHLAEDNAFVSRFRREALSAARLVHPNVVQVYDFGREEASGRQFIVMEYVDGESCAQILRKVGRMSPDDGVTFLVQACRGLEYAHRHRVVHRDVKPGNLLRNRDGVVKLADFGIAKAAEQSDITKLGSVLGTAAYLSPEQARGESARPASDMYALGVVSYQLLAGRLPYEAPSLTELARQQDAGPPIALHDLDNNIPRSLSEAVMCALRSDPADRYDSAAMMEQALSAGLRGVMPNGMATRSGDSRTAATRMISRPRRSDDQTAATRAVSPPTSRTKVARPRRAPLEPLREPPTRGPLQPLRDAPAKRRGRAEQPTGSARAAAKPSRRRRPWRTFKRFMALLILLAIVVGGFIVYDAATRGSERVVQLRENVQGELNNALDQLRQLVRQNTQ